MGSVLANRLLAPDIDGQTLTYPLLQLGVLASGSGSNFEAIMGAIQRSELQAQEIGRASCRERV